MYEIPDDILEQYDHAQVSTMMGLFAELNHAWITVDNALYLWDFTQANPQLLGFEEQPHSITAVKLIIPRPGVFVNNITHIIVVGTTADIRLLGVAARVNPATQIREIDLFETGMALGTKGVAVRTIGGSDSTGRIFFGGSDNNEVYELTYQPEEGWFANRCGRIDHTSPTFALQIQNRWLNKGSPEHIVDMVVDDSRKLLYTLSSESSVRVFHMESYNT
jgi:nuclear pore complex protein Nup155